MANLGEAYVEVRGKTDKFTEDVTKGVTEGLDKATEAAERFGTETDAAVKSTRDRLEGFTKKAVIPATLALGAVGAAAKSAVAAASNLGESVNAVNVTFGEAAKGILALSDASARTVGLSSADFNALAVQFSSFATKIAGPGGDVVATIDAIATRAADFASVMNLDVAEAARIFQSGLAGETEPLKRFGIDLSEAAVKAYAMANGIGDGSGELTEQQKILARHGALMEQTNKTQGDFANTSDSLANRQRIFAAELTNLKANIGEALLPTMERLTAIAQDAVGWFNENKNAAFILGGTIAGLAGAVLAVNAALKVQTALTAISTGLKGAYAIVTGKAAAATAAQAAATGAATAAQTGLNTAMALNPIGLIVVAIGALVAAFVIAYKKVEGFRVVVNTVVNGVIAYFEFMANAWVKAINVVISGINALTGVFRKVGINIGEIGKLGEVSFGRLSTSTDKATASAADFRKAEQEQADAAAASTAANNANATSTDNLTKSKNKASDAAKELAKRVKEMRKDLTDSFTDVAKAARERLDDARAAFDDFAKSVSDAITGSLSFRDAYEAGKDSGSGFFTALTEQANRAKTFGELINRLLANGLSEQALQQVLAAGVNAGTGIAQEILNSADGVIRANTLAAEVASVGQQVGENAAITFRQAGVDVATALVEGIDSILSKYRVRLKSKKLTPKQLKALQKQFRVDVEFAFGGGEMPALANGAIVNRPQVAMIGEAGAEAVIPITRPGRALQLMEQTGLADLARGARSAAVNIESATFVAPLDADLVAQKVLVAEKARSFAG